MDLSMEDWSAKKVVILGAARQGLALARYLVRQGAKVVLNDRKPAEEMKHAQDVLNDVSAEGGELEWVFGGHPLSLLDNTDLLCLSGGIPLTLPIVVEAKRREIPLSNDSQIFMERAPCTVVGITGSAGKTTTTALVGRMAEVGLSAQDEAKIYRKVWVGGNIGSPLIADINLIAPDDLAVMELSSFQLEIMDRSPKIAALLNLTPNHLDRHMTMEAYSAAKARILAYQSQDDLAVLGRDDPGAWALAGRTRGQVLSFGFTELATGETGTFIYNDAIYLRIDISMHSDALRVGTHPAPRSEDILVLSKRDISLRGDHNLLNTMAACTISAAAGLPIDELAAGVREFKGIPHRLEYIRTWKGADWYNDSIATAPERSMAAIFSFDSPLVLLAGGRDKNLPWDEFIDLVKHRVDHLILFGEAADMIYRKVVLSGSEKKVVLCKNLKEAVQAAAEIAQPGDVVLLSPGGTSFDEFKDFEERGECFAQWVRDLN